MIVGGFPPNKLALHSFGGKPFKFAALCAVHSTGAVGTTRAALMAAPVNLAGLRDQLQKGRVFDSREAFVTAVQLFAHRENHHVHQQRGQHSTCGTCALRFPAGASRSTVGTHQTAAACLLYLPFATGTNGWCASRR